MRCGRRSSAPPAATSERLTSGMPSLAPLLATMRSQASAISKPPATAKPSIAAISGLRDARCTMPAKPRSPTHGRCPETNALRSMPAEKPLPAPVSTPTCSSWVSSSSSRASATPWARSPLTALRASGRLSVISRMLSRRSVRTAGAVAVSVSDMRGSLRFAAMRPTVLITGATDGLGRAVAERLRSDGARVLVHGRDSEKLAAIGGETFRADLSSLDEVRALADEVERSTDELHVLVNNAGIGSGKPDLTTRQESRDGFELRFAVNYLAGFVLTLRLLPLLRRSAPARIVNVASLGQAPIDWDDVMIENGYSGGRAYSQSKLAQITFANELAERLDGTGVTVTSLHPATYMPTKIVLEQAGHSIDSLETGVEATVRLATSPELEGVTGRFYDRQAESRADEQAYDAEARRRLWELSLELTGERDPFT